MPIKSVKTFYLGSCTNCTCSENREENSPKDFLLDCLYLRMLQSPIIKEAIPLKKAPTTYYADCNTVTRGKSNNRVKCWSSKKLLATQWNHCWYTGQLVYQLLQLPFWSQQSADRGFADMTDR